MGAEQSILSSTSTGFVQNGSSSGDDPTHETKDSVAFFINGNEYKVKGDVEKIPPTYPLLDFIRDKAGLKGTKYMCREGGCGACVVMVKVKNPMDETETVRAINSCLIPTFAADGWEITTVEGLGNKKDGYHPIQKSIVKFSGTQCGFCTPGMVMNMYSLSKRNPKFKMADVEDSMDGNLCRCTGYRPILDAFKALASDAPQELKMKAVNDNPSCNGCNLKDACCKTRDIEDLECCTGLNQVRLKLTNGEEWIKVTSLANLYEVMGSMGEETRYRLVAGNTGTGVFKDDGPYTTFIDINSVPELRQTNLKLTEGPIKLGGGTTLTEAIELLKKASEMNPEGHWYLAGLSKHIKRVANVPVRSAGTLAGNLMLKHAHREFPSDIFMLLETVGGKLLIGSALDLQKEYTPLEFRDLDMNGKVIISIIFPELSGNFYHFRTFKITRRYQNAHAYVNGGVHASRTESFLREGGGGGKKLDKPTILNTIQRLGEELKPNENLLDASPQYRKTLAQSLLYKTILGILGSATKGDLKSAGLDLEHGPTKGTQTYESDEKEWPLYQPVPKLEGFVQASGEAEYVNDIQPQHGELFGAFVLTEVGNAVLKNVDAGEALMIPGVQAFIQAQDIPGANNFVIYYPVAEEIFVNSKILHAGQPVGLILADTRAKAFEAVKKVKLTYDEVKKPILGIREAMEVHGEKNCLFEVYKGDEEIFRGRGPPLKGARVNGKDNGLLEVMKWEEEGGRLLKGTRTLKGKFRIGGQYHMHMETQSCICIPNEDGMDVLCATQEVDAVQLNVAAALNVPNNSINITVRRLGGGYGGKLGKSAHTATACAVAAHVVNRPVRVVLDLETNMKMIGKRLPYLTSYEVTVDEASGKIINLKASIFCDTGYTANEATSLGAMIFMQNCYTAAGWKIRPGKVITNTPANTYCRSPGTTQGIASIEMIMEHIAQALQKDPLEVRMANLIKAGDPMIIPGQKFEGENPLPDLIKEFKKSAGYDDRKKFAENFNKTNRYRKRGIALLPMRYSQSYYEEVVRLPVFISVYASDGTVSVSHAGIEMGQGINTKCAQVVAKFLGIPLEKVKIKPTNNLISPNSACTGGAIGSELVCHAAMKACQNLLDQMKPVREEMKDPTWEQVVTACHKRHMRLTTQHQDKPGDDLKGYPVWALCLNEVEVDLLTGEYKILRVDLLEDAGFSLSPEVDIGQIEGAFVMGLGLWTTEKLVYDKNTGELLTNNTWDYKPPFSKDIPEDFRVTMLKNRPNPTGVLRSKATGEPPLVIRIVILTGCLAVSVVMALKMAIDSARKDAGNTDWYQIDGPVTPEDVQRLCLVNPTRFDI